MVLAVLRPDGRNVPLSRLRGAHLEALHLANNLADTAATDIMIARDTRDYANTRRASLDGAGVAKVAREALEKQTGRSVVSRENFLPPTDEGAIAAPKKRRK